MEVVYEHCCGLDIHKKTVVACVVVSGSGKQPHKEIRTFNTMTADLLELADWLTAQRVTHVALESTGVYWKPAWNVLESSFTLLLVNARHIKQVPGRKTDVKDCEWMPTCCGTVCFEPASCLTAHSANYASSHALERLWSENVPPSAAAFRRRSKAPVSSSAMWPATSSAHPAARCWKH